VAWQLSDEGRAFLTRSSEAWGEAHRASAPTRRRRDRRRQHDVVLRPGPGSRPVTGARPRER
jgi:hypothetical protein